MTNALLKDKTKNLPTSPGVYLFKNRQNKIIYIGKAKNLRNRVRTYFQSPDRLDPKNARMMSLAADLELIVTKSEVEALILEANLVREHKPRYNIDLKDDKRFPYVKVTTNEPFPRVLIVRRLVNDGATYFGPYTNATGMRKTLNHLCGLFKIRTCNLVIPHPKGRKYKVCLDYHIKRCGGPCEGFQSEEEYRALANAVVLALSGKSRELIHQLSERMQRESEAMNFEEARELRDKIEALKSMMIKQHVDIGELVNRDIIALAREERDAVAVVMQLREGILIGRQDFQLTAEKEDTDAAILRAFLMQYYNKQPNIPAEIFIPFEIPDIELLQKWLKQERKAKVILETPKIGDKVRLLDLAERNARLLLDELLIRKKRFTERTSKMVTALKEDLNLPRLPRTVICFDISNTGETDAVGSSVYFENGRPKKNQYRHFKIKGVKGQDDFKMMREIIGRYFFRVREEKSTPPDLVVVDGGKGQLSAASAELAYLGFAEQPVIGLAKRLEEVFIPGLSDAVVISRTSPGLMLLKFVRDEAHRFAVNYNRKVRTKRTILSELDKIKGIGEVKRATLIKEFGSVSRIRELTAEQLSQVKGINKNLAESILKQLNSLRE